METKVKDSMGNKEKEFTRKQIQDTIKIAENISNQNSGQQEASTSKVPDSSLSSKIKFFENIKSKGSTKEFNVTVNNLEVSKQLNASQGKDLLDQEMADNTEENTNQTQQNANLSDTTERQLMKDPGAQVMHSSSVADFEITDETMEVNINTEEEIIDSANGKELIHQNANSNSSQQNLSEAVVQKAMKVIPKPFSSGKKNTKESKKGKIKKSTRYFISRQ